MCIFITLKTDFMIIAMVILTFVWILIAYEIYKSPIIEDNEKDY
jgi:hypothetical protein